MALTPAARDNLSILAETDFRGKRVAFGIKQPDRLSHTYIIGKTGTGKSTLLEQLIRQDIDCGRGLALLDPHGDLTERVLGSIPPERAGDVIYFNVPDREHPLGFNPLEGVAPQRRALAAAGLLEVFRNLWPDSWGPRLEHILRNALLALFDQPQATLADVLRLFSDASFRKQVAVVTSNEQVRDFWLREFEGYPSRLQAEAVAPIQNKVGAFLADPVLTRIVTQEKSSFKFRQVMDDGKVLLVNLAKGQVGEGTASLLGSMLVSRMSLAAMNRAEIPEANRRPFFIYLDEFHSFHTLSLNTLLSESRKYGVGLILANQYISQLAQPITDAVLGNAGTIFAFRVGPQDTEILSKEFYPEFRPIDLMNLPNYHVYVKLMIDGRISRPFSARTRIVP